MEHVRNLCPLIMGHLQSSMKGRLTLAATMPRLRRALKETLQRRGLYVSRVPNRATMDGALHQLAAQGMSVPTVIDVGAALGGWSRSCMKYFPHSRYLLIEPLLEFRESLSRFSSEANNVQVVQAAVGASDGTRDMFVHADLVGSSVFKESEKELNETVRNVPERTLDTLVKDLELSPPYLVKIDVQGAEIDVLQGAREVAAQAEALIIEVSFLPFFSGGPLIHEVIRFLHDLGFVAYDLVDLRCRPLDDALAQCDIVAVPQDSELRKDSRYATPEQRGFQDAALRELLSRDVLEDRRSKHLKF